MVFGKANKLPFAFLSPEPSNGMLNPDANKLEMQIVSWADGDGFNKIKSSDKYGRKKSEKVYKIRMYGRTMDGVSVCVNVEGYNPYFYVKLPSSWTQTDYEDFVDAVSECVANGEKPWLKDALVAVEKVYAETLYWYDGNKEYCFAKFSFKHKGGFYAYKNVFDEPFFIRNINSVLPYDFSGAMYQSNIEAKLRFMHERDIRASGWIYLNPGTYEIQEISYSRCQVNVTVKWTDVHPDNDNNDIAPLIVASFDGEMKSEDGSFPVATNKGDPVIQIGTTVHMYGQTDVCYNYIVVLGECTDFAPNDPNTVIECIPYDKDNKKSLLRAERKLIEAWGTFIERLDPDILTGYNIWGFDMSYLFVRMNDYTLYNADEPYNLSDSVKPFLTMLDRRNEQYVRGKLYEEKDLNSSGLGENKLTKFVLEGIIQIDVMKVIQGDVTKKLESYKLDYVSELYIGDKKIDLSPKQMFLNFEDGSPDKIAEIAEYCVKDCALCNKLIMKLAIDSNSMGMANVCSVPLSYIFTRGQGIKLFSLVVKQCNLENILCPVLDKDSIDTSSYEGAIVYKPVPGIYTEPIEVLDYASLYPSSMIAENISHDTIVLSRTYDLDGNLIKQDGNEEFMNLPGYQYNKIVYDTFKSKKKKVIEDVPDEIEDPDINGDNESIDVCDYLIKQSKIIKRKKKAEKDKDKAVKTGYKECYYIEKENGGDKDKGILPRIEMALLKARRDTRKRIKYKTVVYVDPETSEERTVIGLMSKVYPEGTDDDNKTDDVVIGYSVKTETGEVVSIDKGSAMSIDITHTTFQQVILDGLQQAYKVTCNSLYGQVGATTSSICFKELAASTTAVGRDMLLTAQRLIEAKYPGTKTVYGDTDSVFLDFTPYIKEVYGDGLTMMEKRERAMELGFEAGEYVTSHLKSPQDLEREKQFYPFIIFSKKRYIANKFELDLTKGKMNSMGIATKRRDNARELIADIYGGTLKIILDTGDLEAAKDYFKEKVGKLLNGGYSLEELKVTKSVKSNNSYANPTSIAPRVLADRMFERDAGNKVMSNERLAYAFIEESNLKCKLCDATVKPNLCKCNSCMELYCPSHLRNHRKSCIKKCRFSKMRSCPSIIIGKPKATRNRVKKLVKKMPLMNLELKSEEGIVPQVERQLDCVFIENLGLFKCNTCKCYYTLWNMYRHREKRDSKTKELVGLTKCKKAPNQKINQGDIIETLPYIRENNLKVDYNYYLQKQIMNPSMQLFSLIMDKPESLLSDVMAESYRKRNGYKSVLSFFK